MNSVRGLFGFLIIPDSKKTRKPQWYSLDRIHLINNDEEELICYGKTVSGGVQGEGGKGYLQGGEGGAYLGGFGGGGGFRGGDNGAGGGGGYSGGNGGGNKAFFCGGGGGSFNIWTNQLNECCYNCDERDKVIITFLQWNGHGDTILKVKQIFFSQNLKFEKNFLLRVWRCTLTFRIFAFEFRVWINKQYLLK